MRTELTAEEALAAAGYTHRPAERALRRGAHDVIDGDGATVATLTAFEVWDWLATQKMNGGSDDP